MGDQQKCKNLQIKMIFKNVKKIYGVGEKTWFSQQGWQTFFRRGPKYLT
jgi:hypothetical protein